MIEKLAFQFSLNKLLSKESSGEWFDTVQLMWLHCKVNDGMLPDCVTIELVFPVGMREICADKSAPRGPFY